MTRRERPEGRPQQITAAKQDQPTGYPRPVTVGRTFVCPATGLVLESPPLVEVIEEGHRHLVGNAQFQIERAVFALHAGRYPEAARRFRLVADRLDRGVVVIDRWTVEMVEGVAA